MELGYCDFSKTFFQTVVGEFLSIYLPVVIMIIWVDIVAYVLFMVEEVFQSLFPLPFTKIPISVLIEGEQKSINSFSYFMGESVVGKVE